MNETNTQQGERLSFFKLFSEKKYRVCIPIIQRDYAQGRKTTKEVRDNFLTALYDYLEEEKPNRDLDFVYGTITDNEGVKEFIPLDGQQRLTTLFLLHWYLSLLSDSDQDKEKFFKALVQDDKSMFTYRTRSSSSEFCDALMTHPLDLSELKPADLDEQSGKSLGNELSKTISNSSWFYLSWRHDPTVQSMLTMLDAIHHKFQGRGDFFPLLLDEENPVITFLFLDLNIFKMSDDLYIKMNSRGKPLTAFENFKAKYEQSLETVDQGTRQFELTLHGKTEKVSLKRYFSHNVDTKWANLLWNYRALQNRTGSKNDFTYDDELMNLIRVVFTNRYAATNVVPPKVKDPILEYLRGSDIAKKDNPDYSDIISYHKYKEFGVVFDKDDQDRMEKKPKGELLQAQLLKNAAYGYAIDLVDTLDCLWNGSSPIRTYLSAGYRKYYDEVGVFKKALKHEFDNSQDRVCFYAYTRFLIYHQGNPAGLEEWMRVIANLAHPENTILDEASDIAAALKSVDKMLPFSSDILSYLAGNPAIDKFSSWQVREEKIKAQLILRDPKWKEAIETVEQHGYFNGQIGFLLAFAGIHDYYMRDKQHPSCDWGEEEDEQYFKAFTDYAEKASVVFLNSYDDRINDKDYVFERAVFTKGNYLEYSSNWRRNLLSTSVIANNVKRDHSWKRYLRLDEGGTVPAYLDYVKAVLDDPRFDKGKVYDSLLKICTDRTGTWRDMFIADPALYNYCGQGYLHFDNENNIVLLSKLSYGSFHVDAFTYYLWRNVFDKLQLSFPMFGDVRYNEVWSGDEEPSILFSEYIHNRIKYEMHIIHYHMNEGATGFYELQFFKTSQSNANYDDYKEDIVELLEGEGFVWDPEQKYFGWSSDDPDKLMLQVNTLCSKLPV